MKYWGHARLVTSLHGIIQGLREPPATPTVVGDRNVLTMDILQVIEILEALYGVGGGTTAGCAKKLARSDAGGPVHAGYTNAVIPPCPDSACHVRAMAVVVHRIAGVGDRVDPVNIVDISVAIIIDAVDCFIVPVAVGAGLAGVVPHISGQVLMTVVDSSVNDANNHVGGHVGGTGSNVPGFWSIYVSVNGSTSLSSVVQAPKRTELRIVG